MKLRSPLLVAAALICQPVAQAMAQQSLPAGEAGCQLELTGDDTVDWRGPYGRGYEVLDNAASFEVVRLQINHRGEPCRFFVTAAPAGPQGVLENGSARLSFDLLDQPNGRSLLSGEFFGTQTSQIEGGFAAGSGVETRQLYVSIPPGQFVRGGIYRGRVLLRLFRTDDGTPRLVAEKALAVASPVASVLSIQADDFAAGAHEINVDLGSLAEDVDRNFGFRVLSNTSVDINVSSSNHGALKHDLSTARIPYALYWNGSPVSLASPSVLRLPASTSNQALDTPLTVKVEGHPHAPAGRYRDTLTITFTAN